MGRLHVSPGLAARLQDVPGVASVAVDLTDSGGGISVRLSPGADEADVMDRVKALLVAYGVRSASPPRLRMGRQPRHVEGPLPIDIKITPIEKGARVEVATKVVRSFRIVQPVNPLTLTQGLAHAWCQVIGRVPVEVVDVTIEGTTLRVTIRDDGGEHVGEGDIGPGWEDGLARAVGRALGVVETAHLEEPMVVNS